MTLQASPVFTGLRLAMTVSIIIAVLNDPTGSWE